MVKLNAAIIIGRRKAQNAGLLRCLLLISTLCIIISFVLLMPCQTNMLTVIISNETISFNGSQMGYSHIQQDVEGAVNNHKLTESEMENIELTFRQRHQSVMDECRSSQFKPKEILKKAKLVKILKNLLIDKERKLGWCPTYKAGSTTWMEIFATMAGLMTPENRKKISTGALQVNYLAREKYKVQNLQTTVQTLSNVTKFIIVRHPLERILSAYRDKLEHRKGREFYYKRYGRNIVKSQRPDNSALKQSEPTFLEFLQFVVKTKTFDEHWRPFTTECAPCELDYQLILKMETLEKEELYLATKFGLLEFLPTKNSTTHLVQNKNPKGRTEYKYAREYYSQIPRKLLQEVAALYEEDFRLFGYSPQSYFEFAKNDTLVSKSKREERLELKNP